MVQYFSEVLNRSHASTDLTLLRQKDGALLALGALHSRLHKKESYANALSPMLEKHVAPDFNSPHGFLRSRACWVYSQYAQSLYCRAQVR